MDSKTEVFKFIDGKAKNRRIRIISYISDKGEFSVIIKTKRLVNFKTREIIETDAIFSYYTFRLLYEFMSIFFTDAEFKKITNRMERELELNKMSAKTNLKR